MDSLKVEQLVVGYRGAPPVIKDISLEVRPGEIVALLGRNGAGKTTLLRAISGLLAWRGGDVALGGLSLRGQSPEGVAGHGIGHVPEGRRVIPSMTVLDNLKLGGYLLGPAQNVEARLQEVLAMFPALSGWPHRMAGTLSGGEQQMLSLARALMGRPSVLMLDEPLTGLAPIFRQQVLQQINEVKLSGAAVLLVEQNVVESFVVADRALIMDGGTVVLEGTPDEMRSNAAVRENYLGV